ncbi:hypothetical protein [Palaeococcus sp. (in: euryarchaeotes)]
MKLEDIYPAPYSGLPGILNSLGMILMVVAMFFNVSENLKLGFVTFWIAWVLLLVSIGKEVEVKNGKLILKYGFPKPLIKVEISEIREITNITKLKRGKIARYFRQALVVPILVLILPYIYIFVKGTMIPLRYVVFLLIPAFVGIMLLLYFTMTLSNYREFLRKATIIVAVVLALLLLMILRIFKPVGEALLIFVMSYLLLVVSFVIFMSIGIKRNVVLIEGDRGCYALFCFGDYNELIRELLKVAQNVQTA